MSPQRNSTRDPRHGTRMGYRDDGCKCDACKRAVALERNLYLLRRAAAGRPLSVDKTGSVRRLQALMVMGWPRRELARLCGYQGDAFALILNGKRSRLMLDTHQRIVDLYDRLSMQHGPSNSSRIRATKKGWAPPLAWDDDTIDDPKASPVNTGREYVKAIFDPVVVERFLAGDIYLHTTPEEKREIVRRWPGSHRELAARAGWKVERYIERNSEEGAA